jgi:hypothetical protein
MKAGQLDSSRPALTRADELLAEEKIGIFHRKDAMSAKFWGGKTWESNEGEWAYNGNRRRWGWYAHMKADTYSVRCEFGSLFVLQYDWKVKNTDQEVNHERYCASFFYG